MNADLCAVIKRLYEEDGTEVRDIAEALGLKEEVVKITLEKGSADYRLKKDMDELDRDGVLSDRDFDKIRKAFVAMTLDETVDPSVRSRNSIFLINEKKGRNDLIKAMPKFNENILKLNNAIEEIENKRLLALEKVRRSLTVEVL